MTDIHQKLAAHLDHELNAGLPRKNGFVLLTFPFGALKDGMVNYVSNADRADMVTALKEIIARFEGQPNQSGTA